MYYFWGQRNDEVHRSKFSRRGYLFISFSGQRACGARVGSVWFSQR